MYFHTCYINFVNVFRTNGKLFKNDLPSEMASETFENKSHKFTSRQNMSIDMTHT